MAQPTYKLSYFNIRGLAQQARYLLIDNGIPFIDERIEFKDWPTKKLTLPYAMVPNLMDGDLAVCQSGAVMRHLARKHDLYGSNEAEMSYADMVYDGIKDMHSKYMDVIYKNYDRKDEYVEKDLPNVLAPFEKLLADKSGGKGLILGHGKFSTACYGGAAIAEYERTTIRFSSQFTYFGKDGSGRSEWRTQMNEFWNSQSLGARVVYCIIGANVLVFCAWRLAPLQNVMLNWFTHGFYSKHQLLPMVLSTFSHYNTLHLALNMYVFWSFAKPMVEQFFGAEQFCAFYLASGLFASFASATQKAIFRSPITSLGASGAILGCLAYTCAKLPDAQLQIIFLPFFTFSAQQALVGLIAFDLAGLILGFRVFDHAAHLGGAIFGLWYAKWGQNVLWEKHRRNLCVEPWRKITGR